MVSAALFTRRDGSGRARARMESVLTFDTDDVRRGAGQLPQDFAKFFSSRCHVTLVFDSMHGVLLSDYRVRSLCSKQLRRLSSPDDQKHSQIPRYP